MKERRALAAEVRDSYSHSILSLTVRHPLFQSAREIYCYASFQEEVWTAGIMTEAWRRGKRVAVPRVVGEGQMDFFYIDSLFGLSPGYLGIPEPKGDAANIAIPESASITAMAKADEADGGQTLIILPGAAFDKKGNRIGYGKGFYDRYLQKHSKCRRIGIAYSVQCVEEIPAGPFDVCVEAVITEKGNYMT